VIIDCDGHILEPPDLWEKYLEARYRSRAIRIRVGDDGYEYLEIDGRRATLPRPGQLGTLGGMGKRVDEARLLRERAMSGAIRPEEGRERTIPAMMQLVGEDKFFWASDYPHPDHPGNYLEELREMVAPMAESGRRAILGGNVARAYKLS
jgi:hypothetical protein